MSNNAHCLWCGTKGLNWVIYGYQKFLIEPDPITPGVFRRHLCDEFVNMTPEKAIEVRHIRDLHRVSILQRRMAAAWFKTFGARVNELM